MVEVECGGFVFTSNFESGNLARVEQVPLPPKPPPLPGQSVGSSDVHDYEFNIWTNPDCAGTEFENSNRSWFYFGIRGGTPFTLVKLNLVNLNRQVKMYSQGMAPVYRILPGRGLWDRIREKPAYTIEDNVFTLSFRYRTLENVRATTYFAFTFPYSYQDLMSSLRGFDKRFKNCPPPEKYFPGQYLSCNADDIYYHREVASYSLDGRRLDLLTITSHHGITPHREPRLKNLFPDLETPRPYIFVGKKVVFVSARVHPGEVPSSYVLNGLLESLLNKDDLTSILLRRMYVFKIIPMLNPDGVARGHFRTDTRGVNLNRVYLNPSLTYHPTIYAARAIIKYAHFGQEVDDNNAEPSNSHETPHAVKTPLAILESSSVGEDQDMTCQAIQQQLPVPSLKTLVSSGNTMLPPNKSLKPCESAVDVTNVHPDISEKDNVNYHCEVGQLLDEDMINSEENTTSQNSGNHFEMDVEKGNLSKIEPDHSNCAKSTFCAGFPSGILSCDPTTEKLNVSDSLRSRGGIEISHERQNKEPFVESVDENGSKNAHNIAMSFDERDHLEEDNQQKNCKQKPVFFGESKPMSMFSGLVGENGDEEKCEDSNMTSCHSGNGMSASLNAIKPTLDPSKSGLYLYMDMHGHASKKGIFMYGNHFDDIEQLVECMLLPKLMSINSQNFHFTACNFTERNMYLRDRRDGMSREGCGRVSVMKITGLVRSYTLECNYNTGRMVNLLPPCVRDSGRMSVNPAYAVPPKYTPLVFEEVGRALGVSILDLTSSNPCSRIPNSEYRSINGIRDWLRSNCLSDSQLWTRMLHRPTRPQVGQSASAHITPSSSGQRPVHLTKSVLLARISTELKTLGEEYARKEHLRMQKTASCSQLDTIEGMSIQHPKENIGPGQWSSRPRRGGDGASLQAKATHSGVLQQRAKTLSVANLPSTSRKKMKSSTTSSAPLHPVSKTKAVRRSKNHESSVQNSSSSGENIPFSESVPQCDEVESTEGEAKTPPSLDLCATPKRLKVSGKGGSGKLRRKQSEWSVKPLEDEEKNESQTESGSVTWTSNRNLPPQVVNKKTTVGKLEKSSRLEGTKFRPGVLTKVKAVKKLTQSNSSNAVENNQIKPDQPQMFVKLIDRLPGAKGAKASNTEAFKPTLGASLTKDWIRAKSSSCNLFVKAGKVDISIPGPSSAEHSTFEGNQFVSAVSNIRAEQKLKSNVLRSLEKGTKSRLLCPVRRRSNDGKKSRKNLERKPFCTENTDMTSVSSLKNDGSCE